MVATSDYWVREGHFWKRAHIQPRTTFYIPERTDDGPDISKLKAWRQTFTTAVGNKHKGNRYEDDWTEKPNKALNYEWTGSTNFEEATEYNAEYDTDEGEQQQAARKATEVPRPQRPTAQERAEHELTHLLYRAWCDICVRTKGKTNSHPRQKSSQPVIQVDMTYIKSLDDKSTTPTLKAIDVETGMSMATLIQDRTQHFEYLVNCTCNFLVESGRAQAILANTVLQSDQEPFLINLLKATALRLGNNISVRQSAAYNSQSQGSVERFHRTLISQIRSFRAQVKQYYDRDINCEQPLMPWLVRHSNYLLNRYLIHNDGNASFYRRWGKEHKTPIFAETVQYMAQTAKTMPKLEQRFFKGIWLGKDTATNEHIIGIANRVVRARTIRRMVLPDNFDKQLLDIINSYPWTPISTAPTGVMPLAISAPKPSATAETQTVDAQPHHKQAHKRTTRIRGEQAQKGHYGPPPCNITNIATEETSTTNANTRRRLTNQAKP